MIPGRESAAGLGCAAEQAVAGKLEQEGYRIIARNYRINRLGELDLVAWKDNRLVIIEVKARSRAEAYGGLAVTITPAKVRRLRQTAWCFLKEKQMMNCDVMFLAALVHISVNGKIGAIETFPFGNV